MYGLACRDVGKGQGFAAVLNNVACKSGMTNKEDIQWEPRVT